VFANARKYTGAGFVVLAADNDVGHARLGMAIAKKRLRRAVDRNRIRRTVRESFRLARKDLPDVDIVVLARHCTGRMATGSLRAELADAWRRMARDRPV